MRRPPGTVQTPRDETVPRRHPHVVLDDITVDEGLADDVAALWAAGIATLHGCQGDAERARYVVVPVDEAERARTLLTWVVETWDPPADPGWRLLRDRVL